MNVFDEKYRARFEKLSTTNVSDACDFYNIHGATYGIRPMIEKWGRMVGRAVTVKMCAAGETTNKHHLGMNAIVAAEPGDIIVIDIPSRSINVKLSDEELEARPQQPLKRKRVVSKALRAYAKSVASADKGGVRIID